jgi:hypothetical protein
MIGILDTVLDHLLKSRVTLLRSGTPLTVVDGQVGFQPPDDDWRSHVNGLGVRTALNVYMLDLRENRKLRSNERIRTFQNGTVNEEAAPARMDCHYLITAWSPANTEALKVAAEHPLLAETMAVVMHNQPLVPRQIFAPNPLPTGFPAFAADADLPCQVLPPEGFPKLAEFWGTMGASHRWKPAIYIVVTVPVVYEVMIAGPMVTTSITEQHLRDSQNSVIVWIQIAGTVRDSNQMPVDAAWVRLETTTGDPLQTPVETDKSGRFTFTGLTEGDYQLHVVALGFDRAYPIGVPSAGGSYDIVLV